MKSIELIIILCCLSLHLFVSGVDSCWGSGSTNIGVLTPDPKVLVGSKLMMNCTLFNTTINYGGKEYKVDSSMISFKFKKDYVPSDRIHIMNSTVGQLEIKNASVEDNGIYYCLLNISSDSLDHNPLVCVTHVTVGYKPKPVRDFNCISVYFRKLLCSWTPQDNPVVTRYTLEDKLHPGNSSKFDYLNRKCGFSPDDNSCEWRIDTVPPYRNTAKKFTLLLRGENIFGKYEQLFPIDHYSIIKPNVPRNIKQIDVTTGNVTLSWSPPSYIEFDEEVLERILYQIRVVRILPHDPHKTIQPEIIDGIRNTTFVLKDLVPFTYYNVSIRCKTIDSIKEEYWSDYASIVVTTKADVPYFAPVLIPESFQTVKNSEGNRSITLYWKPISSEHYNGPDFYYNITYQPTFVRRKTRDVNLYENSIAVKNMTHYTFTHMDSNTAYIFKIYGANVQGQSNNFTQITVDKTENIAHKPTEINIYSYGDGRYELQWSKPRDGTYTIINYTVFWCPNLKPRPFPCEGPIDWIKTSNRSIALELPDASPNYQFAIAANSLYTTSGMAWASCIVPIDGKLDKISDIRLEVINSTSINVFWKLECPAQKRVVETYKINYCKISSSNTQPKRCKEVQNFFTVTDNQAENHILTDLEPFSEYKVTVVALTDLGPSETSDPKYATTSQDSPGDAPSSLRIVSVSQDSISLDWQPPTTPNGKISYYEIACNNKLFVSDVSSCTDHCSFNITGLSSYESYKVKVKACVNKILCSPFTPSIDVQTLISSPDVMHPPRTEIINTTSVLISWVPPSKKNGPIDYYLLKLEWNDNNTEPTIYNVSGNHNKYYLTLNCDQETDEPQQYQRYSVKIAAVNLAGDEKLVGNYSSGVYANACLVPDGNAYYIIGITVGSALGLTVFVIVLYLLIRWMKRKIDAIKAIKIQLPSGLEAPQFITDAHIDNDRKLEFVTIDNHSLFTPKDEDDDSFKNRHGSGTSSSSTEGLLGSQNQHSGGFIRRPSRENAHGSVSSNSSADAHISSDSGTEVEAPQNKTISLDKIKNNRIIPKPPLPIVDEIAPRNGDSSGSKDSGLEIFSSGSADKSKRRKRGNINKVDAIQEPFGLQVKLPTKMDIKNPLYDSPFSNNIYAYSLLANSEPSIFDLPLREDDNMVNNLSKFNKPEMTKSFSNIIQNLSPYSKVEGSPNDCSNVSSKESSRTMSPTYPYSKYGIRRQVPLKDNYVADLKKFAAGMKEEKTSGVYVTMDSIMNNGAPHNSTFQHHHMLNKTDWSQNSYDAEVSSTSSNGDNDQTDCVLPLASNDINSKSFVDCDKIQNDINPSCLIAFNPIMDSPHLLSSTTPQDVNEMTKFCSHVDSPPKESFTASSSNKNWAQKNPKTIEKNSNGYVLHKSVLYSHPKCINNEVKPNIIKNSNGYVLIPEIEMKNVSVPNTNHVNSITQV